MKRPTDDPQFRAATALERKAVAIGLELQRCKDTTPAARALGAKLVKHARAVLRRKARRRRLSKRGA